LVQPITVTGVPGWSQVTSGNARSGPARTLTACVVNAGCARAGIGSNSNSAMKNRIRFACDIGTALENRLSGDRIGIAWRAIAVSLTSFRNARKRAAM
jgi:hypothetical protein